MKSKVIAVGLLVVLALSVVACSATPKNVSVVASIDDFAGQQSITQQVEVLAGGVLTVSLGSNPSTGFQWSENATNLSAFMAIKQVSHEYVAPDSGEVVGAAGQEVWKFEALDKGTNVISMEYSRPWEGGEKAEYTYTLTVTVK